MKIIPKICKLKFIWLKKPLPQTHVEMVRVAAAAFKAALSGKYKNLVLAKGSCSSKTRSSRTLNTP